ncbi:hypothetical protein BDV28DRAFT_133216 [Aspergillus coremiiformis]|uniref:Tse2 ADP-ribosyltransferase toxin domain-containing protein n=1 Tax=Aspergillus coremiiformis TaxID=138285 RepID=A0A5N6Z932_9EURO|nr:hypothetical protein BDV28DRAFT_133216 [Aspergillus coremiiformis]
MTHMMWMRPKFRCYTSFTRNNAGCKRQFSLISVHTKFPATMYRLQIQRNSHLFNQQEGKGGYIRDSITVSKNGLVYPMLSSSFPYSNGPVFRPNTCLMQEILRRDYDNQVEEAEASGSTIDSLVITIRKDTVIPPSLILFRNESSRFSLQPSSPLSLSAFNNILDEFYSTSATFTDAMEWMEKHEFHDAFADSANEEWMGH